MDMIREYRCGRYWITEFDWEPTPRLMQWFGWKRWRRHEQIMPCGGGPPGIWHYADEPKPFDAALGDQP